MDARAKAALGYVQREFGFKGDELPAGYRGSPHSCPIANAIREAGYDGMVNVGDGQVVASKSLDGVLYVRHIPREVDDFIEDFDRERYPEYDKNRPF